MYENTGLTGDTIIEMKRKITDLSEKMRLDDFVERYDSRDRRCSVKSCYLKIRCIHKNVWMPYVSGYKVKEVTELCEIETQSGVVLRCVPTHMIYTKKNKKNVFVSAKELAPKDIVLLKSLKEDPIVNVQMIKLDQKIPVYNLSIIPNVDGFYANGILVKK